MSSKVNIIDNNLYVFLCPYDCGQSYGVSKNELNCRIFRCGFYKKTGLQINQHLSKKLCDELFYNELITGCGKPFKLIDVENDEKLVVICEYI